MLLDIWDKGAELRLWLLLERRLLVDRKDGSLLLDLTDDRRPGTTTTGMPPFFQTSRRAFPLEMEFMVPVEARLSCRPLLYRPFTLGRLIPSSNTMEVGAELVGERSEPESRSVICFFTCRSVFWRRGGVSTRIAEVGPMIRVKVVGEKV